MRLDALHVSNGTAIFWLRARMFKGVTVSGCLAGQPVHIGRVLAAVICRGTLLRSRILRFTPRSTFWVAPRMFVLAECNKENEAVQQPVMKAQKLDGISTLQVKFLSPHAVLPKRGSVKAAGYDLASSADTVVPARGKAVIPTDLAIAIPPNTYARVAPRSGLAVKHFIDTAAGVIDEDYRGPVGVVLFNHGPQDFAVKQGDRIAQLILERIITPEVEVVQELSSTVRGAGGYGSTGTGA